MNCLIVDDDAMMRRSLAENVGQTLFLNLVGSCEDPVKALDMVTTHHVDLVFLDVMMPEMTGLDFMKALVIRPEVIMVTANKEFALDAFEHDVTDFLVKPVTYDRFLKAVSKAKRNFDKKGTTLDHADDSIFIKVSSRFVKLDLKTICYIEALADYVTIHTLTDKYTIHSTMKGIESTLPSPDFIRVHNSYIIRVDKISSIEDNFIFINKISIPVSRNRLKPLLQRLKLI